MTIRINRIAVFFGLVLCLNTSVFAQEYIFSSPPMADRQSSESAFQPLAELLSAATGLQVRYEYAQNWPTYIRNMQQSRYDLVLDAPHFVSWRLEKIEHRPLVRFSGDLQYIVYRSNRQRQLTSMDDLMGKQVCANAIPSLDALTVLDQFADPWNQPGIVVRRGPVKINQGVRENSCQAAILTKGQFTKVTTADLNTVLFESPPFANYALSASPRFSQTHKQQIRQTLLSNKNVDIDAAIGGFFSQSISWTETDEDEFRGYAYLLEDFWGF